MYRKIMIAGATAAVIVGAGGAALATTDSGSSTNGTPATASTAQAAHHKHGSKDKKGKKGDRALFRRLEHGELVLHKKDGTVTRQFARGVVSQVSASDITVRSLDGHSTMFAITKDTKVHERENGKRETVSIGQVKSGDRVFVGGIGTGTAKAVNIMDAGAKKTHK